MDRKPVPNKLFYCKNKFKKLVHLIGFVIRIYHDTRSSECKKHSCKLLVPIHWSTWCHIPEGSPNLLNLCTEYRVMHTRSLRIITVTSHIYMQFYKHYHI